MQTKNKRGDVESHGHVSGHSSPTLPRSVLYLIYVDMNIVLQATMILSLSLMITRADINEESLFEGILISVTCTRGAKTQQLA